MSNTYYKALKKLLINKMEQQDIKREDMDYEVALQAINGLLVNNTGSVFNILKEIIIELKKDAELL